MYPEKNTRKFVDTNLRGLIGLSNNIEDIYITFIQSRINTNLILINNPDLLQMFGLECYELIEETKKLFQIASYVEIPDVVPEKRDKK